MITFDPTWDLDTHQFANDAAGDIAVPCIWSPAVYANEREQGIWKCNLDNTTLAEWTKCCREVVKLPLASMYWFVALETLEQLEAAVVMRRKKLARPKREYDPWTPGRFRESVESVCGEGRKVGGQYWFKCPFHDERNPSFEVHFEKMLWNCHSRCGGGGYIEWEKRVGGKDASRHDQIAGGGL